MSTAFQIKNSVLYLHQGDITEFEGDAIVNAANEKMLGGGGVDGAIHMAAGPGLMQECYNLPQVSPGVRCPTGEARITGGFNLKSKHVIHTVGPIYQSSEESAPILSMSYKSSLQLANEHGLKTIAFPAISTGLYGYPVEEAAKVAIEAVIEAVGNVEVVHFVLFDQTNYDACMEVASQLLVQAASPVPHQGGPPPPRLCGWMSLWLFVSACLMFWDAGFVLNRPRTTPGGDLYFMYKPYALYVTVDKLYSLETLQSGDGFAAAQSYLNLVEASMQLLTIYLWASSKSSRSGDLLGLVAQTMTFWKTVLYWMNDFMRPEEMRYTNPWPDLKTYIFIFFIPNAFWIICPWLMMVKLGRRLLGDPSTSSLSLSYDKKDT